MSQETDPTSGSPKSEASRPSEGEPKKKLSLKEIAERASQSGRPGPVSGGRSSQSELPSSIKTPLPGRASVPSRSSSVPPRASDAGREDSGIVDLKVVQASATAEQKAAAEKAQPATAGLFDDDKGGQAKAAVATGAAKPDLKVVAPAPAAKKGSGGLVAGVVVAVLGLAAAVAIVKLNQPAPAAPTAAPAKVEAAPEPKAAPADQPKAVAAATDPAAPAGTEPAPADALQKPGAGPALAMGGPASPAPAGAAKEGAPPAEAAQPLAANTPTPAAPAKPGDLNSAMQNAVGPSGSKSAGGSDDAEPAAAKKGNQNVPEQPSQGSVQAAIGSVMGGAKACVSGADDVSRAQITFSSGGTVSSVSVSGWASGKSAAGCIKSALKGASVGPFSKPSFTVGVTIRP